MKEFVEKLIGRLEEQESDLTTWAEDKAFEIGIQTAISIVNQLAEEYKEKDCSKCSRRSWYQKGYKDAEKKFAEEMGVSKMENTTTNADRIRNMSDEELAEFLCEISMCKPDYCPAYDKCMRTAYGTMKDWLQSEVKGSE